MNFPAIIADKKYGKALTKEQIETFARGAADGSVPDYQLSALLMAIRLNGMNIQETTDLTLAMANSGSMLHPDVGGVAVDKHSTGGVGDTTTLVLVPLCAACGAKIAKMSGRGLGHTGGTVDKMESIGMQTTLPEAQFLQQVKDIGCAVIGQSAELAPADKTLYALRDATATVDSLPLIASSIMSKKLAAGSHSIVLDVKIGSGAFMKTDEDAAALAREMVSIGAACGRKMTAVLTDMDIPLGQNIGNALEVAEAMEVLRGAGPADLREVSLTLAAEMASLTLGISPEEAKTRAENALNDGTTFAKAKEWIAAQGGDLSVIEDPSRFPAASVIREVIAREDGYIVRMDTQKIGEAAMVLGAGRATKEEEIDFSAGIRLMKKTGDAVKKGDVLAVLHTSDEEKRKAGEERLLTALTVAAEAPLKRPLVAEIIRG